MKQYIESQTIYFLVTQFSNVSVVIITANEHCQKSCSYKEAPVQKAL